IASEILHWDDVNMRVAVIEKWVAVADICRCLHNYNAVLKITSSLNRSSVFRLKRTWLKVSKQVSVLCCVGENLPSDFFLRNKAIQLFFKIFARPPNSDLEIIQA
ncbi:Ras protein-specific guanine nucleotide-releasing factor, partial [Xenoophorus captivus]